MQYQKPEIARLGPATNLILGVKTGFLESFVPERPRHATDSELDD